MKKIIEESAVSVLTEKYQAEVIQRRTQNRKDNKYKYELGKTPIYN
jgi:hypothetical protein